MVSYLGYGKRDYYEKPVHIYSRDIWEFQAVLDGHCFPTLIGSKGKKSKKHTLSHKLWVFPPGHPHGWKGVAGEPCEVAVFHYPAVPYSLSDLLTNKTFYEFNLEQQECSWLSRLSKDLLSYYFKPGLESNLIFEKALLDLSIMVLKKLGPNPENQTGDLEHHVVQTTIAWYKEHLNQGVGVNEAAEAVGYSVSHLRRIFHDVLGRSPKEAFQDEQLKRARDLLEMTDLPLTEIAHASGFTHESSFSRFFKIQEGMSPDQWRRRFKRTKQRLTTNLKRQQHLDPDENRGDDRIFSE